MRPDGVEKKILERMAKSLVARKSELIEYLKKERGVSRTVVETSINSLISKGLISPIYACETTFAITQKGIKEVELLR